MLTYQDLEGGITVSRNDIPAEVSVNPHNSMNGIYDIQPVEYEDLEGTIIVKKPADLTSIIAVNPLNRMMAIVDIIPPPSIIRRITPDKDAFVREKASRLNYGLEGDLFAGYSVDQLERYRSFIHFDISEIPEDVTITRAELKLYFIKSEMQDIKISEVGQYWSEVGITWANQPPPANEVLTKTVDIISGYYSFDILDLFIAWHEGKVNEGLLIQAVNEMNPYFRFYSREYPNNPPILEVEYHLNQVYSIGLSETEGQITVRQKPQIDLPGSIDVKSDWGFENLSGLIHIHRQDTVEGAITISRPDLPCSISVRHTKADEVTGDITVRKREISDIDASIIITAPERLGTITVRHQDKSEIQSDITVRRTVISHLSGFIGVNKPDLMGSINVFKNSDIPGEMTVIRKENEDIESSITIQQNKDADLSGYIDVFYADTIPGVITVRSGYLKGSIFVPNHDISQVVGYIQTRVKWVSDLESSIQVQPEFYYSEVPGGILVYIPGLSDLEGDITVRRSEDIDIPGEVTVRRTEVLDINGTLFIKYPAVKADIKYKKSGTRISIGEGE